MYRQTCGLEAGEQQRFCVRCCTPLPIAALVETPPLGISPTAQPGSFHRLVISAAIAWSAFWLGAIVAGLMNTARQGPITGAGALGLTIELGMMLGIWFVPTVILLLVALVTKPDMNVPWRGPVKYTVAVISVLLFILPLAGVSTTTKQETHRVTYEVWSDGALQ